MGLSNERREQARSREGGTSRYIAKGPPWQKARLGSSDGNTVRANRMSGESCKSESTISMRGGAEPPRLAPD